MDGVFKTARQSPSRLGRQKALAPLRSDGDLPRRQKEEGSGRKPSEDGTNPEAPRNPEFKAGTKNRVEETEGGGEAVPRGGGDSH